MQNRSVRRSLLVGAAALSVASLVGCGATGGADGGGSGGQIVASGVAPDAEQAAFLAKAAQSTGAVQTQRVSISVTTTPADGDPSVTVTSEGQIDADAGRAQIAAEVAGTFDGESHDATIEAVYDGDTVYLKAPFTELLGDTPWVKVTSPKLAELATKLQGGLEPDPGSFLAFLEGAGGPVETLGTEEVRGVPTRHVAVDVDVAKVLDQAPPERREKLEQLLTQRGISLDDLAPLPAEAWIDDDGYVRRFSIDFDLAELSKLRKGTGQHPAGDATGIVTQTIELYDFDEPVEITVPPASEVTTLDLSKLLGGKDLPGKGGAAGKGGEGGKGHGN